jgi:hypothetical protein
MTDINDELSGSIVPKGVNFSTPGTKHVILIKSVAKVAVREFVDGRPAEQLYFQNQKKVRQSELNLQLPYEPIPCWLVIGTLKDGKEVSLRLEGGKLKAAKAAIREGGRLVVNGMIAIEYSGDDPESKGNFPKKVYVVQLKAPKGE